MNRILKEPCLFDIFKVRESRAHLMSQYLNIFTISLMLDYFKFFVSVKEKEDLHPDPEVQSAKDETFGEYR